MHFDYVILRNLLEIDKIKQRMIQIGARTLKISQHAHLESKEQKKEAGQCRPLRKQKLYCHQ